MSCLGFIATTFVLQNTLRLMGYPGRIFTENFAILAILFSLIFMLKKAEN